MKQLTGLDAAFLYMETPTTFGHVTALMIFERPSPDYDPYAAVDAKYGSLVGQLAKLAGARGHFTVAGPPKKIADIMQDWFESGAADGFNLMPPVLPHQLDLFIAEVVPILRQRSLFRESYEGETLRDHFGLSRPDARFD